MIAGLDVYRKWDQQKQDNLIRDHLPLVYSTARRVANATFSSTIELGDLVSAGVEGLYRAFEHFDPTKGATFGTYAIHYIKGCMLDEIRRNNQVPRSLRVKQAKVQAAFDQLSQKLLRMPTDEEIAGCLDIEIEVLHDWLSEIGWTSVWSLDELEAEGQVNTIDSAIDANPVEHLRDKESRALLAQGIRRLTDKEQQVLHAYYEEELTLKEIGYVLGISESQVSRIHSKAILRLRGMLRTIKKDLVEK
ncbi:MAG: FliA/WhiG family polymerase sigma factor [Bacilli bacterium]|nr:FliA/WhiG family polymerase sigma factor [Bacilli bacterium]